MSGTAVSACLAPGHGPFRPEAGSLARGGTLTAMTTIQLDDDELRLLREAVRAYLDDFGHGRGGRPASREGAAREVADASRDRRLGAHGDSAGRPGRAEEGRLRPPAALGRDDADVGGWPDGGRRRQLGGEQPQHALQVVH